MPVLFRYKTPDLREITIKGWTREELLALPRLPALPHYKPIEYEIANKWIRTERLAGTYYFDFRLPEIMPDQVRALPLWVQEMWRALSDYRIDIALNQPGRWLLVEIKDLLSSTAISQPLLYAYLFRRYIRPGKPVDPALVVGEAKLGALEYARAEGIQVWVTGVPSARKRLLGL